MVWAVLYWQAIINHVWSQLIIPANSKHYSAKLNVIMMCCWWQRMWVQDQGDAEWKSGIALRELETLLQDLAIDFQRVLLIDPPLFPICLYPLPHLSALPFQNSQIQLHSNYIFFSQVQNVAQNVTMNTDMFPKKVHNPSEVCFRLADLGWWSSSFHSVILVLLNHTHGNKSFIVWTIVMTAICSLNFRLLINLCANLIFICLFLSSEWQLFSKPCRRPQRHQPQRSRPRSLPVSIALLMTNKTYRSDERNHRAKLLCTSCIYYSRVDSFNYLKSPFDIRCTHSLHVFLCVCGSRLSLW